MRTLYTALKARVVAQDTGKRFKYLGKWNNDLEKLKDGKALAFQLPALLFEFVSPMDIMSIGGGAQVFDPLFVKVHILSEFYNDKNTGTMINLDVYDLSALAHPWLQGYAIKGVDYGSSEFNRTSVDDDNDHDQVYHHQTTYTTTWIDNSTRTPVGGYEIEPPLDAAITGSKLKPDVSTLVASVASLAFGNVTVGQSKTLTFTIQGTFLEDNVILSTTDSRFVITLSTVYKTRIVMTTSDGTIDETTVTVKFTPGTTGAKSGSILFGVPGINGEVTLTGTGT